MGGGCAVLLCVVLGAVLCSVACSSISSGSVVLGVTTKSPTISTNYLELKITPLVTYFPPTVNILISRTTCYHAHVISIKLEISFT